MKRLRVYWRNQLDDLQVLDSVAHLRLGPDEEEVVTTDEGVAAMRSLAREFAENFWMEDVRDLGPQAAAELVCALAPAARWPALLEQLITMVGTEDQGAGDKLSEHLRDRLPPRR